LINLVVIKSVKPILCGFHFTFCKITTDNGIVGWGDGTEWATPKGVESAIRDYGALIVGEDPRNIERIWQLCWRSAYVGGKDVNAALSAIESALYDLKGKLCGVPAIDLMGGRIWNKVRLYTHCDRSTIEGTVKFSEELKREGWTAWKCQPEGLPPRAKNRTWAHGSLDWPTISRVASLSDIKQTVGKIKAVREAVGDEIDLGIDVNNRLDLPSAERLAKQFEPYQLLFFEDPICQHEDAAPEYKRLADSTITPIATGENLYTIWEFKSYVQIGALDVLLPDVSHTGIGQARKIAALAEAYHLPVCPHSPNSPLSSIISANLAASIPNFEALEFIRSYAYPGRDPEDTQTFAPWMDKLMKPPLSTLVRDGYLELPEGSGWGVDMNEDEMMKHPYVDPNKWLMDLRGSDSQR